MKSKMRIEDGEEVWRNFLGKLHREDGPAVIDANGTKAFYIDGRLHNDFGPALQNVEEGLFQFFLNGKWLSFEDFIKTRVGWTDAQKVEFYLKWK